MLTLLFLLGCPRSPAEAPAEPPEFEAGTDQVELSEEPASIPRPGIGPLPAGADAPGSGGLSAPPTIGSLPEAFGHDASDNGLPPMPEHNAPPDETWWVDPAELQLGPESAVAMLVGEWTQVQPSSQKHNLQLLSWLLQVPAVTAEQLDAEGLSNEDRLYLAEMQDLLIEKPETRALLENERDNQAHIFRLTLTEETLTLNTRKTPLVSDYTVKSVHQNQVALARKRITGEDTTTVITVVGEDRIRIQPHSDERLVLHFSR
ncbi:MAG: hypothetical protein P8R54_29230 [Myxococcota bacterium]|nr:hypothetical protein [Myxococcota bacterium]